MKTFNLFVALTLVAGLALVVGPLPVAQAATTKVVLGGSVAALAAAQSSNSEQYLGNGSWHSVLGDSKIELYIDPTSPPFDSLGSFTIADIKSFSYVTKNGGTPSNVDFYINIYTQPYTGGDATWYGNRLTAEPLYANSYSAPINTWNTWTTDSGTNQLTLFDSNHGPTGFYGAPTLADVQAGPIKWSDWVSSGDTTPINYASQTVKYIVLATGSAWASVFEGYVDALTIELSTGPSLTIDLEHHPSEVWVDDDWAGTVPGTDPDGAGPATSFGYDAFDNIQDAIDAVSGSTVHVAAGTYDESIVFGAGFDKDNLTISGDANDRPVVTGGARFLQTATLDGLTFENLIIKGVATGGNGVVDMDNSGVVNDFVMDNCVIDGENTSGRSGFLGQNLGQSFTIINSEFKDILGWALMDINSGSGDGGSDLPLTTVTFADNYIHDSDGSVALRGKATDKTDVVNVYGNTWNNIGGNNVDPSDDEHWAAIEVNHAVSANIYNNMVNDVVLGYWGEGQAFQFWDIDILDMYGNNLTNNAQGIFVYGGTAGGIYGGPYAVPGGGIHNNYIAGNTEYGLSVDATATGGPIDASGNWWGDSSGPGGAGSGSGDTVSANVDYTPWLDSGTDTDPVAAGFQGDFSVLHVDDDSPQAGTTGRIQEGINMVSSSTVLVHAGTYNERVTINKSVDLRGAQYGVDPTATGARTNPANESVITEAGLSTPNPDVLIEIPSDITDVTVDGFTLIGDPTNPIADTSVVRCWDDDINISNNIMDGMRGILYKGNDRLTAYQNRMVVNKNGVVVQPNPATNVTLSDNVFSLGNSPAGDESAIYMTSCSQCSVTGNTATGFVNAKGLAGSNLSQLTVSGNTFTENKDAVSVWGNSTFITICDNDLSSSLRYGISIKGQDVTITGNEINNNGDAGINIARHVIDTERVAIHYNNITGNVNYGVKVDTASVTEIVNATHNWWGDRRGPSCAMGEAEGHDQVKGDRVSPNVRFAPWLREEVEID